MKVSIIHIKIHLEKQTIVFDLDETLIKTHTDPNKFPEGRFDA